MKFVWDRHYSVNVKMIDEQHQHYFGIVNRLYDMLDALQIDKTELAKILSELVDYAFYHLQTEEAFFKKFNYEGAAHHIEMHDFYRHTMQGYLKKMDEPELDLKNLFQEITTFAIDWFANHIMVEDKKYSHCFNEHGLE